MNRKELLGEVDRIVIKVGTSSITRGCSTTSTSFMDSVARQVKALKDEGKEILIVTSGAIGIGLKTMNVIPKPNEIPIKQAAASVGQSILMQKWNESFDKYGLITAQILLTMDIYSDRESTLNLNNTIDSLLEHKVVPIFNENDAICIKEIGPVFGDNDTLSAVIASRTDADLLLILSDVDGLYDKNPKLYEDAKFIPTVESISCEVMDMAGDPTTNVGVGGMKTKIKAAIICQDAGCRMIIASSDVSDIILKTVGGEEFGTVFVSDNLLTKKRRWLKSACSHGIIDIDEGAVEAISNHQSLLPIGIKGVEGPFNRGDVVSIVCKEKTIAKGIPNYNSDEIFRIRGLHSEKIGEVLGYKTHDDVFTTENMVIF
ncbi:MAG: glutamate 5-kinase [Candidatus Cloacimonetes bacterium]|nr:glutamate 5-kinase [Candidatus Cloacimonadota bacterium]